jgi:hypothetical protein
MFRAATSAASPFNSIVTRWPIPLATPMRLQSPSGRAKYRFLGPAQALSGVPECTKNPIPQSRRCIRRRSTTGEGIYCQPRSRCVPVESRERPQIRTTAHPHNTPPLLEPDPRLRGVVLVIIVRISIEFHQFVTLKSSLFDIPRMPPVIGKLKVPWLWVTLIVNPNFIKIDQRRAKHRRRAGVSERLVQNLALREPKAARPCSPSRMIIEAGCAKNR